MGMTRGSGSGDRGRIRSFKTTLLAALLALAPVVASAQSGPEPDPAAASADDIRALVAPVALYPDPMLALVLQASTQPLEIVQAQRFLDKREKDPNALPDPAWDPSVTGLLNYPDVLASMNEYIDWTEELGTAVLDQLTDVQDAILDIRWGAYNTGILVDNDQQDVVADGDIVRIVPADGKSVAVPQYDPVALLNAITPPEADDAATADAAAQDAAEAPSDVAEEAPPPEPVSGETAEEAPETVPEPAPPQQAAAAPVYAQPAPVYAAPPAVTYSEPQDGFWDDAATFAGGAVVGGLLGWGISEAFDDDDDDDDWDFDGDGGRNTNIQDSTVVVARDRDNQQIQNELRNRKGGRQEAGGTRVARDRPQIAPAVTTRAGTPSARGADVRRRDVRLPGAKAQPGTQQRVATASTRARPVASGHAAASRGAGLAATSGQRSDVKKQSARGAKSRGKVAAKSQASGKVVQASTKKSGSKAADRTAKQRSMASASGDGKKAKAYSARGKASKQSGGRNRLGKG